MYVDMLDNEDLVALRQVFDKACTELGIGTNSDDNARREHLAKAILSLAQQGERDPSRSTNTQSG
jgi:hypothetical protein